MKNNLQFVVFLLTQFYLVDVRGSLMYGHLVPSKGLAIPRNINYINGADRELETPLHKAVTAGYENIVELLIARGADISVRNKRGFTPLHIAVQKNLLNIAKILLNGMHNSKLYFKLDTSNSEGNTALHLAVKGNFIDLTKLLIENGANVTIRNNNNDMPLHIALYNGNLEIIEALILATDTGATDPPIYDYIDDNEEINKKWKADEFF